MMELLNTWRSKHPRRLHDPVETAVFHTFGLSHEWYICHLNLVAQHVTSKDGVWNWFSRGVSYEIRILNFLLAMLDLLISIGKSPRVASRLR